MLMSILRNWLYNNGEDVLSQFMFQWIHVIYFQVSLEFLNVVYFFHAVAKLRGLNECVVFKICL